MRVLVVGFGKMGHIYSKYMDEFDISWDYYDPFVEGGLMELSGIKDYSHLLISTPPENHYGIYRAIKNLGFEGNIYIDKPVITLHDDMNIFEDKNLFCGMTERFNPVVVALKNLLDINKLTSIKFSRYSTAPDNMQVPVLFDLGIHDLDLYLYLTGNKEFPTSYDMFEKSKTCYILAQQDNILSIFEWSHESHRRERKIVVLQKDIVYEVNLIDQTIVVYEEGSVVRNLYVDKAQTLMKVMQSFLNNERCDAKLSHEFMFDIIATRK